MRVTIRLALCLAFVSLMAANVHAGLLASVTSKLSMSMSNLPRYEKLPLFSPHRKSFTCVYQEQHVPPADPQAELWFQQALALDDLDIYYKNRDYPRIYRLYQQAAERNHWKAMLNLASLILSDYAVPEHDPEVAIQWVEKAMRLGVPDAYDMMGTYHQNGLIKGGDATSAYAFFQRAADMGSPSAMTFLGYKMAGNYDDPEGEFWGNLPIGTQMLECALAQGYGDAAEKLGFIYARPGTNEAKLRALKVLQEGVKLGCAECANSLFTEFDGFNLNNGRNLVGHVDKARAERYGKIGDALEHYQGRLKLPNLDKVLPLPPAPLPKWDGDKKTLIDAAKAVTPPPKPVRSGQLQGREFIPEGYAVRPLSERFHTVHNKRSVAESGYWIATYENGEKHFLVGSENPERYRDGERLSGRTVAGVADIPARIHCSGHQKYPRDGGVIGRLVDATPAAMKAIAATLPKDFPERVAERIFDGLRGISGTASGDATGRLSAA
jgi:TPR repeat protein